MQPSDALDAEESDGIFFFQGITKNETNVPKATIVWIMNRCQQMKYTEFGLDTHKQCNIYRKKVVKTDLNEFVLEETQSKSYLAYYKDP